MATIGCPCLFPGKRLRAHGDGGALSINYKKLPAELRKIACYGQVGSYHYLSVDVKSYVDKWRAAILGD